MRIKPGASIDGMKSPMLRACAIVDDVYHSFTKDECTLTSGIDGKHSAESLHYKGLAADFRTRDIPENLVVLILNQLKAQLGKDYDVVREPTHIHIEYDQKG